MKMRLAVAIGKLLMKWHLLNKERLEPNSAVGRHIVNARSLERYLQLLECAQKLDLKSPEGLLTLAGWQTCYAFEIFYQSRIGELIHPDDKLILRIKKLSSGSNRFSENMWLGEIACWLRELVESKVENPRSQKHWPILIGDEPEDAPAASREDEAESNDSAMNQPETNGGEIGDADENDNPAEKYKVFDVFNEELEHNIGGKNVMQALNQDIAHANGGSALMPEEFGFVDARNGDGIVKQTVNDDLKIGNVTLGSLGISLGDLHARIEIVNRRSWTMRVVIPAGTVLEVESKWHNAQNVVTANEERFEMPAFGTETVNISGRCLNAKRRVPDGVKGRLTMFRYTGSDLSQDAVWERMKTAGSNAKAVM